MQDVIVIGGSYAGISAALQLARARRKVTVVDAGSRRNRFASHAHGFLGQDGRPPAVIAATARAELLAYPTVTWIDAAVTHVSRAAEYFRVELASSDPLVGKRLVLALGVEDELPELPGVRERWGRSIFHCPYCHGYELEGGAIGVLATSPVAVHPTLLLPDWGQTTYFTRGLFEPTDEERASLERRGVAIERSPVVAVEGSPRDVRVRTEDGLVRSFAGLFLVPKTRVAGALVAELGCALEAGPVGPYVQTDAMRETTVRGVFACGDMAIPAGSVALAVADGVRAGVAAHQSLVFRGAGD